MGSRVVESNDSNIKKSLILEFKELDIYIYIY